MLEKDLEDILWEQGVVDLDEHGPVHLIARQFKVGGYSIDLLGVTDDGLDIIVIELKQDLVDGNAIAQLLTYMEYVETYYDCLPKGTKPNGVMGVLIGKRLSDHAELAIERISEIMFLKTKPFFDFERTNWYIKDEYIESEEAETQIDALTECLRNQGVIEDE